MAKTVTLTNGKVIAALLTIVAAMLTGGTVTYKTLGTENGNGNGAARALQATSERIAANEKGLADLRAKHDADLAAMRGVLDRLLTETSGVGAKVNMLVDMVRDHMANDKER